MKNIKIKCPAKINLTLEIVNKREDGFHNIKSIMQNVNLYDYLDIKLSQSDENSISLSGNSTDIPYNESNLVYKAAKLFFENTKINGYKLDIQIEKHIPVSAGLAGGSTDAAGTLLGLNILNNNILSEEKLHELCAKLGSDLNVCLKGGCVLATGRGEKTTKLNALNYPITIIKPKNLGISAKEAYTKYSEKLIKPQNNMTEKMSEAIKNNSDIKPFLYNDLEYAVYDDYKELQYIKSKIPNSIMSGSGSAFFVPENLKTNKLGDEYEFINNLNFIPSGVEAV